MLDFSYPEILEHWWLRKSEEKGFSVHELRRIIKNIRDIFTLNRRKGFCNYADDENALIAYGLYLFPQTFIKTCMAISEVLNKSEVTKKAGILRVLDLGAGTGAASLSLATILKNRMLEITGIDRSLRSIKYLGELYSDLRHHFPSLVLNVEHLDFARKRNSSLIFNHQWDIILMSYSLGEAFFGEDDSAVFRWLKDLIGLLSPSGIFVVVEPALKETSERLERWRNAMLQDSKIHLIAPCPHNFLCPLLQEGKFWCHEVRKWTVPLYLRDIDPGFNYTLNTIRFSFLALGRGSVDGFKLCRSRLISPVTKVKGRRIFTTCGYDGSKHLVEIFKDSSGELKKIVRLLERGDEITPDLSRIFRYGREIIL